jgi:transcriptional regulator with XRE-family HTH domain
MDYDINYIESSFNAQELYEQFIHEFILFRKENNLTQDLLARYSRVSRTKIARIETRSSAPSIYSLLEILGPIGYTIQITKVKKPHHKF